MSFLLKVWLAILIGPVLLWLGVLALAAILANAPQMIGEGGWALLAIGIMWAADRWAKRRESASLPSRERP